MVYVTGDTHGQIDISKLFPGSFPDGKSLTRDDYMIICGDFGGVWFGDERDDARLEFYEEKKYTILFVDGNHENFVALNNYPVSEWHGGNVHMIRPNLIHLMRGQLFELDGKTFFTFGGGLSIDKERRYPYISWWPEEEPSFSEINEALDNLDKVGNKVDYILTHAAPESIMRNELCQIQPMLKMDCATEKFLDEIYQKVDFKMWFCGHYHMDVWIHQCKLQVLYNNIVKLQKGYPIANKIF
ncbi:metallophosphoesterase [Hungatella hathewayi]|uniref:metallophosphoesterase n=1 Tax=Hungatella hathewayi TaxID=154046 RepID=UPI0035663F28